MRPYLTKTRRCHGTRTAIAAAAVCVSLLLPTGPAVSQQASATDAQQASDLMAFGPHTLTGRAGATRYTLPATDAKGRKRKPKTRTERVYAPNEVVYLKRSDSVIASTGRSSAPSTPAAFGCRAGLGVATAILVGSAAMCGLSASQAASANNVAAAILIRACCFKRQVMSVPICWSVHSDHLQRTRKRKHRSFAGYQGVARAAASLSATDCRLPTESM